MKTLCHHKVPTTALQRVLMHFRCMVKHGHCKWHLSGIKREFTGAPLRALRATGQK